MRVLAAALLGPCLLVPSALFAQAPSSSVSYQFQFINPGARSLALGGAFTGLSDDATAVFANPAGLTVLTAPEISVDIRSSRVEAEYFSGGRTGGVPTGRGIDTVLGARYDTTVSNTTAPAFASFVYPRSRFVLAVARSQVLRVKRTADTQGLILRFGDGTDFRDNISRNIQDLTITSYGATVAVKIGRTLSIGGGLSLARFGGSDRELIFANPQPSFGPSQFVNFNPVDLRGTPLIDIRTEARDANALEGRIGLLWRPVAAIQVGASYRRGPRFATERNAITFDEPEALEFKVPDVLTAGIAIRPTASLTITSDVSTIDYKDLSKSSNAFDIFDAEFPRTLEVHAGAEYVFTARFSPALRVGAWREPYSGPVTTATFNLDLVQERFPSRSANGHIAFGGGLSLSQRFEVNAATDISSRSRIASVSAIVRF